MCSLCLQRDRKGEAVHLGEWTYHNSFSILLSGFWECMHMCFSPLGLELELQSATRVFQGPLTMTPYTGVMDFSIIKKGNREL